MSGHRPFGELRAVVDASPAREVRTEAYVQAMSDALQLGELRSELGVSRIEHQEDLYLSTLRSYVEALGGELQLQAVFADRTVRIVPGSDE